MFVFDQYLGKAELSDLVERLWGALNAASKSNVAGAFNGDHSDEFYRGVVAALHACAQLLDKEDYPVEAKPVVVKAALGYVAGRLATGKWPDHD